jgi:hypothetical protein
MWPLKDQVTVDSVGKVILLVYDKPTESNAMVVVKFLLIGLKRI